LLAESKGAIKMKCGKCGKDIPENSNFCPTCEITPNTSDPTKRKSKSAFRISITFPAIIIGLIMAFFIEHSKIDSIFDLFAVPFAILGIITLGAIFLFVYIAIFIISFIVRVIFKTVEK